jgi:hypothetical protein
LIKNIYLDPIILKNIDIKDKSMKSETGYRIYKATRNFIFLCGVLVFGQIGFEAANVFRNRSVIRDADLYSSEKELYNDFQKEKKELCLEDVIINLEVVNELDFPGCYKKISPNAYDIRIKREYLSRFVLKHEMKHIQRRIKNPNWLNYLAPWCSFDEWTSTSYGLSGD